MARSSVGRPSMVQQIREGILDLLRTEGYQAGSNLPSEQELAERFEVSRATVREALKTLVEAGLLDCRPGKGYFVLSQEILIHKPITHLQSVTELMSEFGYSVENRVLRIAEVEPSPQVCRELRLSGHQSVLELERVRCSRNEVFIYSVDTFPRALIPGDWREIDWSGSLLSIFSSVCGVHVARSRAVIRAALLDAALCARIGVPPTTVWLAMEQVNSTAQGEPVLFSQDYHRGEFFEFYVTRRRF
jgi:GntR family transcriptional regulator